MVQWHPIWQQKLCGGILVSPVLQSSSTGIHHGHTSTHHYRWSRLVTGHGNQQHRLREGVNKKNCDINCYTRARSPVTIKLPLMLTPDRLPLVKGGQQPGSMQRSLGSRSRWRRGGKSHHHHHGILHSQYTPAFSILRFDVTDCVGCLMLNLWLQKQPNKQ